MRGAALALSAVVLLVACAGDGPPCGCAVPSAPDAAIVAPLDSSQALAFLIDRTIYYAHVESDLPDMARKLTAQALANEALRPGDVIYGAWITPRSPALGDDFLSVRTVATVDRAVLRAQPTRPPEKRGQIGCGSYCKDTVGRYQTELELWQKQSDDNAIAWRSRQDAVIQTFIQDSMKTLDSAHGPIENDYPDIRGALYGVSRFFEQHAEVAVRKLVVYSGLIERPTGSKVEFKLPGVSVLVAQYHRHGAEYQREGEATWLGIFQASGAKVARTFLPDNATSVDDIASFIKDRQK